MKLVFVTFKRPKGSFAPTTDGAHQMVYKGRRQGLLKKTPCCVCGEYGNRVVAHHEDYAKPNVIVWLCEIHHKERHRQLKALNQSPAKPPIPPKTAAEKPPRRNAAQLRPIPPPRLKPPGICLTCNISTPNGRKYCIPHLADFTRSVAQRREEIRRANVFAAFLGLPLFSK